MSDKERWEADALALLAILGDRDCEGVGSEEPCVNCMALDLLERGLALKQREKNERKENKP